MIERKGLKKGEEVKEVNCMYEFCRGGALLPGWLVGCHDNNPSQLVNHPRARPIHPLGFTDPTTDTDTTHCRFLSCFNSHPSSYPRFIPRCLRSTDVERATTRPNDHPSTFYCGSIFIGSSMYIYTHIMSSVVSRRYREKSGKNFFIKYRPLNWISFPLNWFTREK